MFINIKNKKGFTFHLFPRKKMRGFTLIETIVGLFLGILIIIIFTDVIAWGIFKINTIKNLEKLHSNAIFLVNNFNYWIKQAENLDATSSTGLPPYDTLNIKFPDSSTTTIKKVNNSIVIGNTTSTTPDIEVQELAFTKMARSVQISLTINATGTNNATFTAKTTVAQRNKP